jgi:hypothetical protein
LRTREEVTRFFDGWLLEEPGVVNVNEWWPEEKEIDSPTILYGAVGRKAAGKWI